MTVGDRIKEQRDIKEMSQTELATKVKISKQTLYKYENNIITNIPSDKIEKISEVLQCSPSYLMGWEPTKHTDISLSQIEEKLIFYFRNLNKQGQEYVLQTIDLVKDKYKKSDSVSRMEDIG